MDIKSLLLLTPLIAGQMPGEQAPAPATATADDESDDFISFQGQGGVFTSVTTGSKTLDKAIDTRDLDLTSDRGTHNGEDLLGKGAVVITATSLPYGIYKLLRKPTIVDDQLKILATQIAKSLTKEGIDEFAKPKLNDEIITELKKLGINPDEHHTAKDLFKAIKEKASTKDVQEWLTQVVNKTDDIISSISDDAVKTAEKAVKEAEEAIAKNQILKAKQVKQQLELALKTAQENLKKAQGTAALINPEVANASGDTAETVTKSAVAKIAELIEDVPKTQTKWPKMKSLFSKIPSLANKAAGPTLTIGGLAIGAYIAGNNLNSADGEMHMTAKLKEDKKALTLTFRLPDESEMIATITSGDGWDKNKYLINTSDKNGEIDEIKVSKKEFAEEMSKLELTETSKRTKDYKQIQEFLNLTEAKIKGNNTAKTEEPAVAERRAATPQLTAEQFLKNVAELYRNDLVFPYLNSTTLDTTHLHTMIKRSEPINKENPADKKIIDELSGLSKSDSNSVIDLLTTLHNEYQKTLTVKQQ